MHIPTWWWTRKRQTYSRKKVCCRIEYWTCNKKLHTLTLITRGYELKSIIIYIYIFAIQINYDYCDIVTNKYLKLTLRIKSVIQDDDDFSCNIHIEPLWRQSLPWLYVLSSPNGPGLVNWPQYERQNQEYMELGLMQTVRQKLRKDRVHFATVTLPQKLELLTAAGKVWNWPLQVNISFSYIQPVWLLMTSEYLTVGPVVYLDY